MVIACEPNPCFADWTATLSGHPDDGADDADGASKSATPDDGADDTTGRPAPDPSQALECDEALVVGIPLFGPAIDPTSGEFVGAQQSYVVSTTQLVVSADPAAQQQFDALVGAIVPELMAVEGLLGASFAGQDACGYNNVLRAGLAALHDPLPPNPAAYARPSIASTRR